MLTTEEQRIIAHLRKDSRASLVAMSEETNIPQSTIYDKLHDLEQSVIKKHTCLLNYKQLGYAIEVKMALKIGEVTDQNGKRSKEDMIQFLKQHKQINSAFHINSTFDFFIECIFRDYSEMFSFINELKEKFNIEKQELYHVLHEIKHEEFLTTI
ncbi:Lrp/AsnC family transcriptional regulator [Candidatus Woesearchaeota archaeon]|nr:Lrp/AsnC family transcriptional regulator [Candidatus Woesearchaeota archaeon]